MLHSIATFSLNCYQRRVESALLAVDLELGLH